MGQNHLKAVRTMAVIIIALAIIVVFSLPSICAYIAEKRKNIDKATIKIGCLGVILFVIFVALSGASEFDTRKFGKPYKTNKAYLATAVPTVRQTKAPSVNKTDTSTPSILKDSSGLEVHFLDVGQGDAALVLCKGKAMLIDGGTSKNSSFIYAYLKEHNISHLDYIIATHGHADHVGGLAGALNYATVGTVLCPVSNYDSEEFNDFVKYLEKQNVSITIPEVGDDFPFGGARFKIVGPVAKLSNHNDVSLVLRLVYGSTSFLFTGDAERQEEYGILTYGSYIKSNVLKVGHHGSNGSTSAAFLKKVSPEYAVISVGSENVYGFPEIETLNALRNANVKVFRTDLQGTIVCKSDRNNLTFSVERNPNIEVLPTPSPTPTKKPVVTLEPNVTEYVLNKNTKKFHYPSCSSVDQMKEKNKLHYVGTREEVIRRGYEPCGRCYP